MQSKQKKTKIKISEQLGPTVAYRIFSNIISPVISLSLLLSRSIANKWIFANITQQKQLL